MPAERIGSGVGSGVPGNPGPPRGSLPDLEVAATKYLYALPDGSFLVSDTGHHRLVQLDNDLETVRRVIAPDTDGVYHLAGQPGVVLELKRVDVEAGESTQAALAAALADGYGMDTIWDSTKKKVDGGGKISNAGREGGGLKCPSPKACTLQVSTEQSYNFTFYWLDLA